LKEFVDPKNFKSYDELKRRLNEVLELTGPAAGRTTAKAAPVEEDDEIPFKAAAERKSVPTVSDDDDDLDYFKSLADD
jgi:hypothetical protein